MLLDVSNPAKNLSASSSVKLYNISRHTLKIFCLLPTNLVSREWKEEQVKITFFSLLAHKQFKIKPVRAEKSCIKIWQSFCLEHLLYPVSEVNQIFVLWAPTDHQQKDINSKQKPTVKYFHSQKCTCLFLYTFLHSFMYHLKLCCSSKYEVQRYIKRVLCFSVPFLLELNRCFK